MTDEIVNELKEINKDLDNSNILKNILRIVADIRDDQLRETRDMALANVERKEKELKFEKEDIKSDFAYKQRTLDKMRYM